MSDKIWQRITPETWCQGSYATDLNGKPVAMVEPGACKFCALGWIFKNYGDSTSDAYRLLSFIPDGLTVEDWNDDPSRTFEEVKEAFKKAEL